MVTKRMITIQDATGIAVSPHLQKVDSEKWPFKTADVVRMGRRAKRQSVRFEISCRLTRGSCLVSCLRSHSKPTMSNFGTGQGLFGPATNQNKNQTSSTPGAAPASGASPFANLGANTTNSSVFGGAGPSAGAGNTPGVGGTTSGTTGGIFGTGGSAFGGGGNPGATAGAAAGTGTASPFSGAGPFGGVHASFSLFMELSHLNYHLARPATTTAATGAATGGSLFPSASSNTGTSGTTSGGLFGNNPSTNTAATGGTCKPNTHEIGILK